MKSKVTPFVPTVKHIDEETMKKLVEEGLALRKEVERRSCCRLFLKL